MANPIGNLRQSVSNNMSSLRDGGAAALGTLILGGSKAEAAMAGVGQAILTKVVGPLGKLVGITAIATRGLYNLTKAWATMGTGAAAKLETVQNQLRVMLKGLDAAKQRVRELRNFSISTPFKMGDIVAGNRALEGLTKGALTTKKAMTQVGDAAAQAGVNFEDMAVYVGRLYDGLAAGRPVGEVLFRLAELGVISGQARNAIEQLQESGAGFSEVWRVVESELSRSSGTMGYTSKTLDSLQDTLADTEESLKATFSENFLDGQKQAVEAQIATLENLKPVVKGLGSAYGGFVSVLGTFEARVMKAVTSIPGMAHALEFLGRMAGVAAAGITALAVATGAANLMGKLSALTGSATLAGRALGVLGVGARALSAGLMRLVTGPMALVTAAVAIGYTVWSQYNDRIEQAAEAVREYNGATDALVAKLEAQAAAVRTLDGLQQQYAQTLGELANAYDDYTEASREGDTARANAAARRTELLGQNVKRLEGIDPATLELPADVLDNQVRRQAQARDVKDARLEAMRSLLRADQGGELIGSLGARVDELSSRRGAAIAMNQGVANFQQAKARAGIDVMGAGAAVSRVEGQLANARGKLGTTDPGSFEAMERQFATVKKLEEELQRLKQAEQEALAAELKLAQGFDNTIVQIQSGLSLYSRYQAAVQGVFDAKVKLAEAEKAGEGVDAAQSALNAQTREVERLQKAYDALGWSAQEAQRKQAELAAVKDQMQRDMMNEPEQVAAEQQLEQAKRAEREKQARLMAERGSFIASKLALGSKVAGLAGDGDQARLLQEMAAREAELSARGARVNELRASGFGEAEAGSMADQEIRMNRAGRALDAEGGLLQALLGRGTVVDSMQRIGGGGGVGSGPNIGDVVNRLDELIRAVKDNKEIELRL